VAWLGSLDGHTHHSVGSKGLEEIAAAFMAMVCPLVNGAGSDQDSSSMWISLLLTDRGLKNW